MEIKMQKYQVEPVHRYTTIDGYKQNKVGIDACTDVVTDNIITIAYKTCYLSTPEINSPTKYATSAQSIPIETD